MQRGLRALMIGGSDGIGLATTRRLLEEGWTVVGISRSASPIDAPAFTQVLADVAAPEFRERLVAVVAANAPFDVCLYCAGIGDRVDLANLEAETRVFAVNLMGAVVASEVILPRMIERGSGHLLVLSSLADSLTSGETPGYNASKAGMSSYFEGLALTLRARHSPIAITNVRFGFVDTKMAKSSVRPFMVSAERAADVILRALRHRPIRVTHPWPMAALVWALRWVTDWKICLG